MGGARRVVKTRRVALCHWIDVGALSNRTSDYPALAAAAGAVTGPSSSRRFQRK